MPKKKNNYKRDTVRTSHPREIDQLPIFHCDDCNGPSITVAQHQLQVEQLCNKVIPIGIWLPRPNCANCIKKEPFLTVVCAETTIAKVHSAFHDVQYLSLIHI